VNAGAGIKLEHVSRLVRHPHEEADQSSLEDLQDFVYYLISKEGFESEVVGKLSWQYLGCEILNVVWKR